MQVARIFKTFVPAPIYMVSNARRMEFSGLQQFEIGEHLL